jgi:hypothetical protein
MFYEEFGILLFTVMSRMTLGHVPSYSFVSRIKVRRSVELTTDSHLVQGSDCLEFYFPVLSLSGIDLSHKL